MFFIIFFSILFLFELYAFQGIKTIAHNQENELLRFSILVGYWLVTISLVLITLYGIYSFRKTYYFPSISKWTLNLFITLLVTKIVMIIFLFSEDVFRIGSGIFYFFGSESKQNYLPERRLFLSQTALAFASIPFISFLYGITKGKYNYKIHELELYFEDLPGSFENYRILQFSDFHSGSFDNFNEVQRGLKIIQDQACDIILFTGDLVNNRADEFEPYFNEFKNLKAPDGKYSILGNHDYGDYVQWDSEELKRKNLQKLYNYYKESGFELLNNSSVMINKGTDRIYLSGVENWGLGFGKRGDLDLALKDIEASDFKILLSHDPTHWEEIVKKDLRNVQLTLSGHTHGAQMGIEIPGLKFSPVQFRYAHWAGLKKENNMYHYINRGFGFLGFSGRVGIWPEITVITLKKGSSPVI